MSTKAEKKEIELQQKFVKWLKENDIYNPFANAHQMREMMQVWKLMRAENKKLKKRIEELTERAGCPVCGDRGKSCVCDIMDGIV
jgi:hypothetical protein